MDVRQIVAEYLKANGFDGLSDGPAECGCKLEDLMPCSYPFQLCKPGHRVDWATCPSRTGEDAEGCTYGYDAEDECDGCIYTKEETK